MRLIEFVGMVGAGKSVLAERLITHLRAEGREVLSIEEALRRATSSTSTVSTVTGPKTARRLARIIGIVRFAASNRALAWRVVRSQIGLPITARHRLTILRLVFRQMGTIAVIDRYLANDEIVVLDEGPVHRAVNLFSWAGRVDLAAARAYLNLLPAGGLVVHVAVPTALASARTAERGYPKRLDTVDPVAVETFMAGAAAVVDLVAEHLTGGDRSVIMVGNDRALDATLEELTARVDDYLDEQIQPRLHLPFAQRVAVPRPDRLIGRRGAVSNSISDGEADELLSHFGLELRGPLKAAPHSGRSDTAIVPAGGRSLFVKRYKDSVSVDAVQREHAVLAHLARRDFPTPRLITTKTGATLVSIGDRHFAAFELLEDRFHYHHYLWPLGGTRSFIGLSASTLAGLHRALSDFGGELSSEDGFTSQDGDRPHDSTWAAGVAADRVDTAGPELDKIVARLAALEGDLDAASLSRGMIHGDYGPYNLLFAWNDPVTVVDLELARYDWLITDIAKALAQFGTNRSGFLIDRMRTFVRAYSTAADIDPAELILLPAAWEFLTLRRAVVCWDRYRHTGDRRWIHEANAKLGLASSIAERADTLAALHIQKAGGFTGK